jgi:hypothetical protein
LNFDRPRRYALQVYLGASQYPKYDRVHDAHTSTLRSDEQHHDLLRAKPLLRHTLAPFPSSSSHKAWSKKPRSGQIGLTTRRYQSGEVDYDGHISRRGDRHLRGLLYEAAAVILTRSSTDSTLRTWGLKLRERIGFKRAAVAVARKLAVIMHTMLKTGELFNPNAGATA